MSRYIRLILKGFEPYILDELVKTGTTVRSLKYTEFQLQSYPLPPIDEQQRIVETVDRLMDECDALEQQQERERILQVQVGTAATEALQSAEDAEALHPAWERVREHFDTVTATPEGVDALRQTILQLAVQGRLTERAPDDTPADMLLERIHREKQRLYDAGEIRKPKSGSDIEDQELPFDLPTSWKWARLTDAVQRVVDCLHKTAPFEDEDTGYYCVDTTCMNETEIEFENLRPVSAETYEEWTRRMVPQGGDILFSREGNIGLTAIVPEDMKLCLGQRMMIFRLPDELLSRYFHLVLQAPVVTKQWKPEVMGTAATRVNISTIRDFLVPIPPVEEQARITRAVNKILPNCEDLKTKTVEAMERGEDVLQSAFHSLSTSTDRETVKA
jgi:type I restriction enzyme S subunit